MASRYPEGMTGSRLRRWLITALLAPALLPAQPPTNTPTRVELTPSAVIAGSPELIRVKAPDAAAVTGEWLTRKIAFFRHGDVWFALAGVDVEAPLGPSTLHISAQINGAAVDLSQSLDIHAAHYKTGTLSVSPQFVEPPPEALKEIEEESKIKARVL